MTATREISRPSNRSSVGSVASSLPSRHSHSRGNSSSLAGSLNPAHRVSRRKSVSNNAASNAAAAAAGDAAPRRTSKANYGPRGPAALSGYPSMPSSLPNNGAAFVGPSSYSKGSVVTDGPPLASIPDSEKGSSKSRIRRASEGSRVTKDGGKRASGSELRCEKCGKGWEHTPEWAITSKLLISKHQQVQLLEAASVLVNMNAEAAEAAKAAESDHSSASPAGSGSSDYRDDGMSSAETTPPPHDDVAVGSYTGGRFPNKRFSSNSSAYSQSYQSNNSVFSESAPHGYLNFYRQQSTDGRPTTSGTSATAYDDEDQADLAAAVGLLSCSYGTPQSKPTMLPPDVPPVPPLPARFANSVDSHPGTIATPPGQHEYATSMRSSYVARHGNNVDEDVDMEDDDDDYERQQRSRGRSDEDDEGMFGRMEE
ncbi:putative c2h2 finger domain protein [Neofusicoccum parvum UCRNP2]|uniref:Putative c2h2 finger domain protein n=1 Tax=Botryosphaeria parva (strain UCR-NP2) TaxID=1287680 RepID=R1GX13_BOTPV|nr:putative c2h2 finger domain protein [Neofusicoccum parvum UCRNP2]